MELTRRGRVQKLKEMGHKLYPHLRYGYPKLETCLQIIAGGKYSSHGFPVFFLDYNYSWGYWQCLFRNPKEFSNPEIRAQSPTGAVHEMLDFLIDKLIAGEKL